MQHKVVAVIAAILITVSLASCGTGTKPGGSARPSTPISSSPTPTPTAVNTDDPATWVVSDAGIGPFQLGVNLAELTAVLPTLKPKNTNCPNPLAFFFDVPDISIIVITDSSGGIVGVSAGNPFQIPNAPIDSGLRPLSGPHTAQGIGYGSTKAELVSAYPSIGLPAAANENFPRYTLKTMARPSISFNLNLASQRVNAIAVWPDAPPAEICG